MTVRSTKSKKAPAKTTQKRKPGITSKCTPKPTQRILWRGKQITEFGKPEEISQLFMNNFDENLICVQ